MKARDVDFKELLKWYHARDTFVGVNNRKRSVAEAIRLARECDHEEARWLADLFPEEVKDERLVLKVIRSQKTKQEMCRYLSFLPFCRQSGGIGYNEVHLAAVAGYAPAQAWMAKVSEGKEEKFKWASKSASQHDPGGLWQLALCYQENHGCDVSAKKVIELARKAAELGWVNSQVFFGLSLEDKYERMVWLSKAALFGRNADLVRETLAVVKAFEETRNHGNAVFLAGATLRGNSQLL